LSIKAKLQEKSEEFGFSKMGVCRPTDIPEAKERLAKFVDAGFHGQMGWMAERMAWRGDPSALWPEARSVIMLAELYSPEHDPMEVFEATDAGAISVYAQNKDYHDVVKRRLKRLGRWLIDEVPGAEIKVFVDTAPVMEKPLAQAAGLGWQGKHTNLVSRELGSWFFLGAIFTTVEIDPDSAEIDHCGSCRSCLDVCPTDAFPEPYRLDARRCISYLTIEHKGPVDPDLRENLGTHIYGCDDCLAACPWNKFAKSASEIKYAARDDLLAPKLAELVVLDDAAFRQKFSGSPIKRIGRNRFVRNVLYAIGNSGRAGLIPDAQRLLSDPDETIKDAAIWAVSKLERR
jgi:epoxyqueuosine reductase